MSAITEERIGELFDAAHRRMTATEIAEVFGLAPGTVLHAVHTGKLPAEQVGTGQRRAAAWLIRPRDALFIWGHRLRETTTA
ncbi:MerR family transcriptional regulator [Mycobacteroides abscessus]|uniref:hypothetical protein n=1 Tax=Mycobacteroides abscessus TaxID=36809 RepID=UPI00092654B3|nr:hypothetical protein [Mycobacteroides abscessus]SHP98736.1 Uncharacterised protein [Mycobacteroides abscessus subsp. abscessus]SHQ61351.1 Uncharacterised protein [Mycobacteroides abscessus subsp. abscessus]SKD63223.1 Uncharacterised protein [Mycobacteroides abscessus subsp. abscessus]SLD63158.1 Uncharacterised protein [Mycobacteroides abscessus subsp. abscessus]